MQWKASQACKEATGLLVSVSASNTDIIVFDISPAVHSLLFQPVLGYVLDHKCCDLTKASY